MLKKINDNVWQNEAFETSSDKDILKKSEKELALKSAIYRPITQVEQTFFMKFLNNIFDKMWEKSKKFKYEMKLSFDDEETINHFVDDFNSDDWRLPFENNYPQNHNYRLSDLSQVLKNYLTLGGTKVKIKLVESCNNTPKMDLLLVWNGNFIREFAKAKANKQLYSDTITKKGQQLIREYLYV